MRLSHPAREINKCGRLLFYGKFLKLDTLNAENPFVSEEMLSLTLEKRKTNTVNSPKNDVSVIYGYNFILSAILEKCNI